MPNGNIVTGSYDRTAKVWDWLSPQEYIAKVISEGSKDLFENLPKSVVNEIYTNLFRIAYTYHPLAARDLDLYAVPEGKALFNNPSYAESSKLLATEMYQKKLRVSAKPS